MDNSRSIQTVSDRRKSGDAVVVHEDTVTRSVIVDRVAELQKLNLIAEAASRQDFLAPKAWESPDPAVIIMERIPYEFSSQDLYRRFVCGNNDGQRDHCEHLVAESGRALAVIHGTLTCNRPKSVALPDGQVVLHGDFGFSNLYADNDRKLVVFDPFPDFYSTFDVWQTGHPAVDLGMFAGCMIGRLKARDLLTMKVARVPQLLQLFLDQYNAHGEFQVSIEQVLQEARRVTQSYFSCKGVQLLKRTLGYFVWDRRYQMVCRHFKKEVKQR